MNFDSYKKQMMERFSRFFDIEENCILQNYNFDIFAKSIIRNERYIVSKKATIYAFENNEYCLLKYFQSFEEQVLNDFIKVIKSNIDEFIKPNHEHMSSTITGIIVVDTLHQQDIINRIRKFNYQKSFAFGFKGWVNVRLILIDLENKTVTQSKNAKKVEKFYQPLK